MFIAGLDATKPEPAASTSKSLPEPTAALETQSRLPGTSSAQPVDDGKPPIPALVVSEENGVHPVEEPASDQFEDLKGSLRTLFGQKVVKGKIWQTPGRGDTFKMVMVDRVSLGLACQMWRHVSVTDEAFFCHCQNVRLPTRKILPQVSAPTSQPPSPHSPLSPLTATSPLYPDGIISPIWMRKHSDMIPSVFVLFLRLLEFPANESTFSSVAGSPLTSLGGTPSTSPPAATSTDDARQFPFQGETRKPADIPLPDLEKRRKEAERLADEELVKVIAERRRKLVERGIKFTIVLMTGRDMLGEKVRRNYVAQVGTKTNPPARSYRGPITRRPIKYDQTAERVGFQSKFVRAHTCS
jgi:trafficking protein particle complex subunit 11